MGLEDKRQSKEIDGFTYEVTPLPFGIGRQTLKRTVDILSPVLAAAFKGGSGQEMYANIFAVLPDALSDDDLKYFSDVFGKASKYQDGDKMVPLVVANQELHFAGRYLAFVQWLVFCLEVNYAGFFSGINGDAVGLMAMVTKRAA